jgi:hypothetical protein
MNWDKLKGDIGYKVQLVPVACHLMLRVISCSRRYGC